MSNKKEIVGDLAEGKAMSPVVDVHEFDVSSEELAHELNGMDVENFGDFLEYNMKSDDKYEGLIVIYSLPENHYSTICVDFKDRIYIYAEDGGFSTINKTSLSIENISFHVVWNDEFHYFEIESKIPHKTFQILSKMNDDVLFEGIVFSVKDLEAEDLPSAKLVSDLKECTDFQAIEIEKLKTKLSESEGLHSILTENGLATQSKVTELKGFTDLQDKMIDNLISRNQELIANLYETKILADDRQNQILKLEKVNQELGRIYSDNMAVYTGELEKEYYNLIDSGAKDAVIAKDRIDELTNTIHELTNTIHELNSQLNEFGAMP